MSITSEKQSGRFGFEDDERAVPIKEPPQYDHYEANRPSRTTRFGLAFLEERELFSQEKILGDERDPRTKEQTEERQQLRILQQAASLDRIFADHTGSAGNGRSK